MSIDPLCIYGSIFGNSRSGVCCCAISIKEPAVECLAVSVTGINENGSIACAIVINNCFKGIAVNNCEAEHRIPLCNESNVCVCNECVSVYESLALITLNVPAAEYEACLCKGRKSCGNECKLVLCICCAMLAHKCDNNGNGRCGVCAVSLIECYDIEHINSAV